MVSSHSGDGRVFALTGGIGSGKSTVAAIWREQGLPVVEADQMARKAVEPGTPALVRIAREFGPGMLDTQGRLDRKALSQRVFRDEAARELLNQIVHPQVKRLARGAFQDAFERGEKLVAYEIPLLFETGQQENFRPVVVVAADQATQLERAWARDGGSREDTMARIASQFPLEQKVAEADFVIENRGTLEELRKRALEVLKQVRASC